MKYAVAENTTYNLNFAYFSVSDIGADDGGMGMEHKLQLKF